MDEFVVFKKDITLTGDFNNIIFTKGRKYKILSEDDIFIYVSSKTGTNECSKIPKDEENHLFEYK